MKEMRVIIVTGRSGSGKSITLHLLEDLGYYCIDNLPASLLQSLTAHVQKTYQKIAIGIDARNPITDLESFHHWIESFRTSGLRCEILYLDASDDVLIKRFNETRRRHPLSSDHRSLQEAIAYEKKLLDPLAHLADLVIDTSLLSQHKLRDIISNRVEPKAHALSLLIQSFGFKFGVPVDSDFVFDVRVLPNPYWHSELRPYSGLEEPIQKFLNEKPETHALLMDIEHFLMNWLPKFENNNRAYMTVSIGCTGGQHRSVYIAKMLYDALKQKHEMVLLRHRELI